MATLRRTLARIADFVFGETCYLCRASAREPGARGMLCAACDADLPRLVPPLCPRCGLTSARDALCGRCIADPPAYDATFAALAYRFPADVLVQALKYRGELALARLFGALIAERGLGAGRIDRVMPVPLSRARLKERGYNQALEIARPLAAALGVPLDAYSCVRRRDTPAQTDLPWAQRARNVRGAFHCGAPLEGAVVAVVDDVMTTGATLAEVAKALKRAGAARVVNCVAVRTPPPGEDPLAAQRPA